MSDERQEVYRQIREMSADPLNVDLARPHTWMQPTTAKGLDGSETSLPRYERHLLCDENGLFPEDFKSSWEIEVLAAELKRKGTIAWYRNPSRASQDSLGVTYEDGDEIKIVRPDFIFFARLPDGAVAADIVDPHGIQFGDALPKLKGLARYAEENQGVFRRIESIAEIGGSYKLLDLTEPAVRKAVLSATSAKALYEGSAALDYSA